MTNFEKWKQELTIDNATELLGDLAALKEDCLQDCPAKDKNGCCANFEDDDCNDVIHCYFMEEAD